MRYSFGNSLDPKVIRPIYCHRQTSAIDRDRIADTEPAGRFGSGDFKIEIAARFGSAPDLTYFLNYPREHFISKLDIH
jgi:hypothetical protein